MSIPSLFTKVNYQQDFNPLTSELAQAIQKILIANNYRGYLSKEQADSLRDSFNLSDKELYFALLPFATCYAYPTNSKFFVGAVVEDLDGQFFFGANLEFPGLPIQFTVHAEQCAINHAFLSGSRGIKSIIVNYSPCGHCRQFINELNTAKDLKIFLPQIPDGAPLSHYLPDSFGPSDLEMEAALFDNNDNISYYLAEAEEVLVEETNKGKFNYSPYTKVAAIALLSTTKGETFVGRTIENAAYNPTMHPVISALILARLYGVDGASDINKVAIKVINPESAYRLEVDSKFIADNFALEFKEF